jgi:hypothetical protein
MHRGIAVGLLVLIISALALAQGSSTPSSNTPGRMVRCRDFFHRNEDGSWSANAPVQIGGTTVGTSLRYKPGGSFSGIDFAKACEEDGLLRLE